MPSLASTPFRLLPSRTKNPEAQLGAAFAMVKAAKEAAYKMTDEPLAELHKDPNLAAEMAVNAVLFYLNDLNLEAQEKQFWVNGVFDKVRAKIGPNSSGAA